MNFPSVSAEEFKRLQPYVDLGERLGAFIAQMNDQRINQVSIRYYGELAQSKTAIIRNAIPGVFKPILSTGITVVNAAGVAAERGIDVVESHSTRTRNYPSLISLRLRSSQGERWVEGAVFEHATPRLVLLDGVMVEAHLEGTMIVTCTTSRRHRRGGHDPRQASDQHRAVCAGARWRSRDGHRDRGRAHANPRQGVDELRQVQAIREVVPGATTSTTREAKRSA